MANLKPKVTVIDFLINVLEYIERYGYNLKKIKEKYNIRINNQGEALEEFVKNSFAGTLVENIDTQKRNQIFDSCFSYLGNQNNPPDLIIKYGEAIEIKKIEGESSRKKIPLNSSYPKSKLYKDDPRITETCRNLKDWENSARDIIYVIGVENKEKKFELQKLYLVYGDIYAADKEVYERIAKIIKDSIEDLSENIELRETKELGKVAKVDPLGITDLRIRGMWNILSPRGTFGKKSGLEEFDDDSYKVLMLIRKNKWSNILSNNQKAEKYNELKNTGKIIEKNVQVKDPNNPANLIDVKLIAIKRESL